jgi:hypothetical protein
MDAREVVVTITGAHKAIALAKCIEEGVNHMWTVSAIQMHPKGLIVCDEDSTLELHVKASSTVRYGGTWGSIWGKDKRLFGLTDFDFTHADCQIFQIN